MSWRVSDAATNLFTGQAMWAATSRSARRRSSADSTRAAAAPPRRLKLATFTGIQLTTSTGHRAGFASWWTHSKVIATSNGTSTGTVRAQPANLPSGGTSFPVNFLP